MQDLRQPLADGEPIQILTTRDTSDPDALAVLRHSTAHLLAEAVRRLYPGVKVAIGPPIENGFYYDFDFPEPLREEDLEKIEAELNRELKEGREWTREEISRDEAKARFEEEGEPYKVELVDTAEGDITLYTQGDFTDLCRGPHLQNSKPIKAVKLTSLAGAYWRGDSTKPQLTRIYGTAFYSKEDLDAYLERLEEARKRDHRKLGVAARPLPPLDEHSPGSPFWHPKGMVIWNELEDLRRRENGRRGYLEVKTPLLYDVETYVTSGHYENYKENIFFVTSREDAEKQYAMKPMNCPGHMLLFGSALRSYRDLPLRYAGVVDAAPQRARRHAARPAARAPRHPGRRAHLLHGGADRGRDLRLPRLRGVPLRPVRDGGRASSSRPGPTTSSAPTRSGTSPRARCGRRSSGAASSTSSTRRRRVLRPEDRPAHEGRRSAGRGRWGRSSSTPRCRSGSGSRTWAPTTRSTRRT